MINTMFRAPSPHYSPSVELDKVWLVEADKTYDILATSSGESNRYIALRTTIGNGILTLRGIGDLILTPNSLVIFKHNKVIRYYCESVNWSFVWFEFYADPIILPQLDTVHNIIITSDETSMLNRCFNTLDSSIQFSAMQASCAFCSILVLWVSSLSIKATPHAAEIEKTIKYIIQNPSSDISVSMLAKIAGMSERLFRDVFKEHTQKSPKKYIEERRLNAAKELLATTNMQVKVVALSLGFTNQYYFSRAFNIFFGLSPRSFRNSLK